MKHRILRGMLGAVGAVVGVLNPGAVSADPASDLQLAARFSPVLILSTDLGDPSIKVLKPEPVEIVGAQAAENITYDVVGASGATVGRVESHAGWQGVPTHPGVDLAQGRFAFMTDDFSYTGRPPGMAYGNYVLRPHWDYPGEGTAGWDAAYFGDGPQSGARFANTAYVHVFERGGWPGHAADVTVIQYYYFYPYNDWVNNHEGDWPRIHVVLSSRDPQTAAVLGVEYLFHGKVLSYYNQYSQVSGLDLTPDFTFNPRTQMHLLDERHPVVYVSAGGHGSYPTGGAYDLAFETLPGQSHVLATDRLSTHGLVLSTEVEDSSPSLAQSYDLVLLPEPDPSQPNMGLPANLSWLGANVKWGTLAVDSPPLSDNAAARGPYHHGWGAIKLFNGGTPGFAHQDIPYSAFHASPIVGEVTWSGTVDLLGDVVVYPGAKLIIEPGTTVRVASGDIHRFAGGDDDETEIFVYGELDAQGSADLPVSVRSASATTSHLAWGGLRVLGEGRAKLRHTAIENALTAVHIEAGGTVDWGTDPAAATRIATSHIGVHARAVAFSTVQNLDMDDVNLGVWVDECHSLTLRNVGVAKASANGLPLVLVEGGTGNVIANNSLRGNPIGAAGIDLRTTTLPLVYNNAISSVAVGIRGQALQNPDVRHNNIADVGVTEFDGVACVGCTFVPPRYAGDGFEPASDSPLINLGIDPPTAKSVAVAQADRPDMGRFGGTPLDREEGESMLVFSQDFSQGVAPFNTVSGQWSWDAAGHLLRQNQSGTVARAYADGPVGAARYTVEAKLRWNGNEAKLIYAGAEGGEAYRVDLMYGSQAVRLMTQAGTYYHYPAGGLALDEWYRVRADIADGTVSVFLDGQPLAGLQDRALGGTPSTHFGVGTYAATGAVDYIYALENGIAAASGVWLSEDFNDGSADGWLQERGYWTAGGGQYYRSSAGNAFATVGEAGWTDYTVEADLLGVRDAGVLVRARDADNAIVLIVRPNYNDIYWHIRQNGIWGPHYNTAPLGAAPGSDLHVQIVAEGTRFVASVNGEQKTTLNVNSPAFASGKIGLYAFGGASGQRFDNITVAAIGGAGGSSGPGGLVVDDAFNDGGAGGWTTHGNGVWNEGGGMFQVSGLNGGAWADWSAPVGASTYTIKTRIYMGGWEGKVVFHRAHLSGDARVDLMTGGDVVRVITGQATQYSSTVDLDPWKWYEVEVEVDDAGNGVSVWVDGVKTNDDVAMTHTPDGHVGIGSFGPTHFTNFDYFQVWQGTRAAKPSVDGPLVYRLEPNYPNPFNPETTIGYTVPARGQVTLDVYNALGQKVRRLVEGERQAGNGRVVWDGTDASGKAVSTGVYFYRLQAAGFSEIRKMTLLR